ncbi:hypothetical protein BAE44_0023998 [Dichanthelium oligosanthes]|uniref:Uncharacterized protein n=1 Tax=Dichanthelium oligosanthes TaxID=888268 RepID=A0A1E5UQ41_9POAL|nr:hypothetical protein BAE44_0023998 [Dichanthelium oligosanthes]
MASSSSLTFPLHLLRCGTSSSARLGRLSALYRPSSSRSVVRLQPTRGLLRPVAAAASYHDEAAAGHGDNGGIAAASVLLHQVDDVAELRAARVGRAPQPPKGRPGKPKEDGGGKIHAAPTSAANRALGAPAPLGLPAEGSGGQGGSRH